MVKKILLICMSIVLLLCIEGCGDIDRDIDGESTKANEVNGGLDDEIAREMLTRIISAIEKKDIARLKSMFSEYAVKNAGNIDEQIQKLINSYNGTMQDFDGSFTKDMPYEYGKVEILYMGIYNINTAQEKYKIKFIWQTRQDFNPDRIGLYTLQIVPEDESSNVYWVDEEDIPGAYSE